MSLKTKIFDAVHKIPQAYWDSLKCSTNIYYSPEFLEAFEKENDIKVNTHYGNRRKGDVEAIYADASYAEELLNCQRFLSIG